MIYEREPSPDQRSLIEESHLEVPLKVVAGAGTGKTFVLAHRFAWLVLEERLKPDRILALTFTDNAAEEMRSRIRRLLRLNGQRDLPPLWIHTFHSFAARLLRENAYRAGLNPDPRVMQSLPAEQLLDQIVEAVFHGVLTEEPALRPERLAEIGLEDPRELRRALLDLVHAAKGNGLLPEEFEGQAKELEDRFWSQFPALEQAKVLGRDETIKCLCERLEEMFSLDPLLPGKWEGTARERRNEVLKLYWTDLRSKNSPLRAGAQEEFDRARRAERILIEAAGAIYRLYRQELEARQAIDFDGMIIQAVELLRREDLEVARRYRESFDYLLIDEFQDTSPSQLAMLELIAQPQERELISAAGNPYRMRLWRKLLVVGDQKQSIYGWRNARPDNLDKLLPVGSGHTLEGVLIERPLTESYRLTEAVVAVANLAGQEARRQDPPLVACNADDGTVISCPPFEHERGKRYAKRDRADYVAREIRALRDRGEIQDLAEVTVLLRSHSAFRPLKIALERHGLTYQTQGGVGFFEHPLARDLISWLQVLHNPEQDMYLSRLLLRAPYQLTQRALYLLLTEPVDQRRRRRQRCALEIIHGGLREHTIAPEIPETVLEAFWKSFQELRDLASTRPAREVLEALWRHCVQHVQLTQSEVRAAPVIRGTFEGVLRELESGGEAALGELVRALELYLEDENATLSTVAQAPDQAVQIMTIHAAKGLESPVVFLLGWPRRSEGPQRYDERWGLLKTGLLTEPKQKVYRLLQALGAEAADDENTRLAYVGITRAQRRLYVVRCGGKAGAHDYYPQETFLEGTVRETQSGLVPGQESLERWRPALPKRLLSAPPAPRWLRTSFTQLTLLERCPRAWLLSRQIFDSEALSALELEQEPLEQDRGAQQGAALGSAMHAWLAEYYRRESAPPSADGLAELAARLARNLPPEAAGRFRTMREAFMGSEWAQVAEPREVERPVHLVRRVGETLVQISGAIDLWLPESGRLVDFKTERHPTEDKLRDHSLQMHIYAQALRQSGHVGSLSGIIVHLGDQVQTVACAERELEVQAPRLEAALARLLSLPAAGLSAARDEAACTWCPFTALCAGLDSGTLTTADCPQL